MLKSLSNTFNFLIPQMIFMALTTTQVFAAATNLINCPPVDLIKEKNQFKHPWLEDESANRWAMQSISYKWHLATWNTFIAVPLPNVTDPVEAIKQGAVYFNTKTIFSEPKQKNEEGYTYCTYTAESQPDVAIAITPPLPKLAL